MRIPLAYSKSRGILPVMNTTYKICVPTPARRLHDSKAGFNLVEMMVAMAIIAIGLFALISGLVSAIRADRETRETVIALNIARNVLEDMRNYPFNSVYANYSTGGTPGPN